ncbi:MAG: DUF2817 domain-containing protein, partial [Lentisphaeria bacterium]|nr:DUF2817 domain-containing protein [Lentisphaeria bacterium]
MLVPHKQQRGPSGLLLLLLLICVLLLGLWVVQRPATDKVHAGRDDTPEISARPPSAASAPGRATLPVAGSERDKAAALRPAAGSANTSGTVPASHNGSGRGHHGLFQVTEMRPDCTLFSFTTDAYDISELERADGRFARVRSATGWPLALRGKPELPVYRVDLLLPERGDYELQLLASEYVDIPCLPPVPSCGLLLRSAAPFECAPDPAIYGGAAPFPAQALTEVQTYRLRGAAGLAAQVAPFQYLPDAGVLRVYTRLDMALRCAGSRAEDYPVLSDESQYAQLQSDAFINAGLLRTAPASVGTILMLCPDAWTDAVVDFVTWKERVGYRVLVSGYPTDTGAGAAAVKAHVQSAYENDAVSHVLLCGDEKDLPPYERSTHVSNPEAYPPTTDIPYAWVDGDDIYADLFLSRLSASSSAELGQILTKLRRYEEQATLADEHAGRALFMASDASGSEGISLNKKDWAFLNEYRQTLIAAGCISADSPTLYDPGAQASTLIAHLNDGVGLMYYLGHGQNTTFSTTGFSSAQAKALSNGRALPLIVTPVCNNGNFAYPSDCLAEAFFKATDGGGERHGAAAVIASTSETYWNPPIYLLQEITDRVVAAMSAERLQSMGAYSWAGIFAGVGYAAISSIPDEFAGVDAPAEYFAKQMHVFGDASQVARLRQLVPMTVSHVVAAAADGAELLTVSVTVAGNAAALAGAAVCVQATDGARLAAGRTNAEGIVTLRIDGDYNTVSLSVLDAAAPFYLSDISLGPMLLTPQVQLPSGWPATVALELSSGAAEWSLASGALPEGIVLAADGILSGTAVGLGRYEVQVHSIPQTAPDLARDFALVVDVVAPAEVQGEMVEFFVGRDYALQLPLPPEYAQDAYRCEGVAGVVPAGMAVLDDARCVGQPTAAGVSEVRCLYHDPARGYLAVAYRLVTYAEPDADADGLLSHQELLQFLHAWYDVGGLPASRDAVIGQWTNNGVEAGSTPRRTDVSAVAPVDDIPVGMATPWRVGVQYRSAEELQVLYAQGLDITSIQDGVVWLELSDEQWQQLQQDDLVLVASEYLLAQRRSVNSLYLSDTAINERLLDLAAQNWDICRPDYIGQSTLGRDMLALRLGARAADTAVPELLLTGAIHGDERPGAMLALRFAEYLLEAHAAGDERVRSLLDKVAIWVVPMVNPDGVAAVTRKNANNMDLNRDFPDGIVIPGLGTYAAASPLYQAGRQLETRALMRWCASRRFSAALHMHTGARLVCYPYGNNAAGIVTNYYSATPDDTLFRSLAVSYAVANTAMAKGDVINGSAWYICDGEFADWQYRYLGTLAMTVELMGPDKESTSSSHLERLWQENREALLGWAEQALAGVAGQVRDRASGRPVPHAQIRVSGTQDTFGDRQGRFHRTLSPGTWQMTISAPGYADTVHSVSIAAGATAQRDVAMDLVADCWLEPQFGRSRYLPTYANTLGWQLQVRTADASPDAWIVSCALPSGWALGLADDGTGAAARRWDDAATRSWLFLREDSPGGALATLSLRGVDNPSADGVLGFTLRRHDSKQALPLRHWLSAEPKTAVLALRPGWNFLGLPLYSRVTASIPEAIGQLWRWTPAGYRLCGLA